MNLPIPVHGSPIYVAQRSDLRLVPAPIFLARNNSTVAQ
jgi:hypothetical protein